MIFVEGLQVVADGVLVVERLGHQHGHSLWQRQSAHDEEFKDVVQRGGVAHTRLHNGADVADVAQCLAIEDALAGLHPRTVAPDGVDLTVMGQHAERLCQRPRGEGVGGEARMHQCQARGEVLVAEVGEVFAHLHAREHTFIYNILAAQAHDVEVGIVHPSLDTLTDEVEDAVELRLAFLRDAGHEQLLDVGLHRAGALAQAVGVRRHRPQVHQRQSLALYLLDDDGQDVLLPRGILRQEHESRAIVPLFGNGNALQQDELVRNLQHDARTVARLPVGALGPAVAHVLQHG